MPLTVGVRSKYSYQSKGEIRLSVDGACPLRETCISNTVKPKLTASKNWESELGYVSSGSCLFCYLWFLEPLFRNATSLIHYSLDLDLHQSLLFLPLYSHSYKVICSTLSGLFPSLSPSLTVFSLDCLLSAGSLCVLQQQDMCARVSVIFL